MHPRLYMQSFQYVSYDCKNEQVIFTTRLVSGSRFHFILSRNQFLALDDVIVLIKRSNSYGHFPLGHNMWMHYNAFDASIYKDGINDKRIYFIFTSFDEYIAFTHNRLLSLVRLNDRREVDARTRSRRRGKRASDKCEVDSSSHKRPLSTAVQSSSKPTTSKSYYRSEREIASRTADNVIMSHDDEESSIFSKWHGSNSRRRHDSYSDSSYNSKSALSPEAVQLTFSDPNDSLVSE